MSKFYVAVACLLLANCISAQPVQKAANDAFVITRMAEKFHVRPKPLNDELSATMFDMLLKKLDAQKLFFTKEDINGLSAYRLQLDDEIRTKSPKFLQHLITIYQQRLQQTDTMVENICKQTFNFSLNEKYTIAEDTSYAADVKALRSKLYKSLKRSTVYGLALIYDKTKTEAQQKKTLDSAESMLRKKFASTFKRYVQRLTQGAGGIQQKVADDYCRMLANSYDPHTTYMTATDKENFESGLGQKSLAFGFDLDEDEDGNVKIDDLKPGSPAFQSGQMNKGDKIIAIQFDNNKPIDVVDASINEVMGILASSNHSKTTLTIKKQDGTTKQITLQKEKIETDEEDGDKVRGFLLKGEKTIGYISLPVFYEDWENEENINGCANDVAKEIVKLKKEGIDGLILDVRYNGGGSLQEAVELSGIFIDAGPIAQIKSSRDQKIYSLKDANRGTIYDGPLVMMVNGYSASASEFVAGALQDYNRALIVGTPTYGKATGQAVLPLDTTINLENKDHIKRSASAYIKLTLSHLYRVNGTTAQFKGVIPDVILPDATQAENDKERDVPNAIPSVNIEANKYYKPNPALPIAQIQSKAEAVKKEISYFAEIEAFVQKAKAGKKKDISLKLADFVKDLSTVEEDKVPEPKREKAPFTIHNHSFETQRLLTNVALKEMNDEWKEYLLEDAYLKAAYGIILSMIK